MRNEFLSKVFGWLGIGLLVTFLVAYFASTNLFLLSLVFSNLGYLVILLLEIFLAIFLTTRIGKMSSGVAKGVYIGYSALTGLTFSSIFILFEISSIIWVFLATSIIFLVFAIFGRRTNIDLSRLGTYLMIGLFSIIIIGIINMFIMNNTLNMVLCSISVVLFTLYVAYDVQKIVRYYSNTDNMAIVGAFQLYLDFVNIFLDLLRLFGRERN